MGRRAARLAWVVIVLLTLGVFVAGVPLYFHQLRVVCLDAVRVCLSERRLGPEEAQALERLGLSLDLYAAYQTALEAFYTVVYVAVAALIFRRVPTRMGLLVSLSLALMAPITFSQVSDALPAAHPALSWLVDALGGLALFCFLTLFYLFPDGRFVPGWTRLMPLAVAAYVLWVLSAGRYPAAASPLIPLTGVTLLGLSVGSQIHRYARIAGPTERQQIKWVLVGWLGHLVAAVVAVLPFAMPLAPGPALLAYALLGSTVVGLVILLFPLCFAIAILRHRLYDVDVVINRALVYGALTAGLGFAYWASVLLWQRLLAPFTQGSELAVLGSTLAVAALFQPARRRVQAAVDRRFYRRRYDAVRTLEAFASRVRTDVDLETLTRDLHAVVQETMQPTHTWLWLRTPPRRDTVR
jgi:hypothetical protein